MGNNELTNGALFWNIKKVISKGDYNYALVPEHPNSTKNGYVLLHRIVIENHLGRLLNADEIVHHIDKNKKNNLLSNLQLTDKKEHTRNHNLEEGRLYVKLKCPWCNKEFELPRNQSFLQKSNKYKCTCCDTSCRGKFYRYIQLNGVTKQVETAISVNLLLEYRKYSKDNTEETYL